MSIYKSDFLNTLNERGFIHRIAADRDEQAVSLLGWPARMSASDVPIELAPGLGEHTSEVLQTELGLSAEAIGELMSEGIVA